MTFLMRSPKIRDKRAPYILVEMSSKKKVTHLFTEVESSESKSRLKFPLFLD